MDGQQKGFFNGFFRHPWLIVIITGIITVFFAFQLPRAELDNNNIRFIPENDESRLTSRYIDDTFGSSFFILVALERKYGDVFDADFLNRIREFNRTMEGFEIVGNINSIVSSDYISREDDAITVQKLAPEDFSGTRAEISSLKQKLLSWDIYRRSLISDDFSATQILIPMTITAEMASNPEFIDSFIKIRNIAMEMFRGYADVYVTGLPVISAVINEAMRDDLKTMIPLVILVVLLVLFFSFRKLGFVALPLITVVTAVVWSIGAMPLAGIKLSVVSSVLPVILVAVGSAYGIHMVTHYLEDSKVKPAMNREEHFVFVLSIVKKIGKAVFLSAVTTMAGFSSFCFTSVLPIREFGFFSTFGVLVTLLAALTLIPALLIIRGPKLVKGSGEKPGGVSGNPDPGAPIPLDFRIAAFFVRIVRNRGAVVFAVVLVVLLSSWGVTKVVMDNVFVEYFKATTDISRSDRFIREKFGGSKVVSVVAQADTTEALLMPDVLCAMDGLGTYLEEQVSEAGKVMGFTDLVKRVNQVLNADESPEGLRPGLQPEPANGDDGGFGFGDFGFGDLGEAGVGDFGFGEAGFGFDDEGSAASSEPALPPAAKAEEGISAGELMRLLKEAASSGKDRSMDASSLVREMEKLVNYEGAAYYEIPADPARYGKTRPEELQQLVANYLVLLSGDIGSYANDPLSPTAIKTAVQLRTVGNEDTGRAIQSMRQYITDHFPPGITAIIGGSALVESSLNRLVVESQIISLLICVVIVFLMLVMSNRSLAAGFIGIAPLSICVFINFAVMGFSGIKLNIGTSMMASLSMGIGIDYSIHYMEAYKREFLAAKGQGNFLVKTFTSSGRAIFINALSVGAGFAVLLFSQFIMLKDLGFLIAITMGSSALVSLSVLPVLLSIINPKFIRKELKES